jgi:hypothetical protein
VRPFVIFAAIGALGSIARRGRESGEGRRAEEEYMTVVSAPPETHNYISSEVILTVR